MTAVVAALAGESRLLNSVQVKAHGDLLPGGLPVYFPDLAPRPRVTPRDVIYRVPTAISAPLDDAAWRHLLQGLPPSMRGRGPGRGGRSS